MKVLLKSAGRQDVTLELPVDEKCSCGRAGFQLVITGYIKDISQSGDHIVRARTVCSAHCIQYDAKLGYIPGGGAEIVNA